MLHDSLQGLLRRSAIEVARGRELASGLLNPRLPEHGDPYRPRLIVVSGLASLIGRVFDEPARDDMLVIGRTVGDDTHSFIGQLYACCPETARDLHKRQDLEEGKIVRLGHSALTAAPEEIGPAQADLYHREIYEKLSQLYGRPESQQL